MVGGGGGDGGACKNGLKKKINKAKKQIEKLCYEFGFTIK